MNVGGNFFKRKLFNAMFTILFLRSFKFGVI